MKEKRKTRYESSTFKDNLKEQNRLKYKTNDAVRESKKKQNKLKYSSCPTYQEDLKSRNKNNYMNEEFKKRKKEYNKMRYKTRPEKNRRYWTARKRRLKSLNCMTLYWRIVW